MDAQPSPGRVRQPARTERPSAVSLDPRSTRTHTALTDALISLAQTKPLPAITINEIVEKAGVHRTTFYGHYADIFAFAADVGTSALAQLTTATSAGPDPIPQMLRHILENRPLYRLVFGPLDVGFRRALFDQAAGIVARRAADPMTVTFIRGGLFAVLEEWTNSDSTDIDNYAAAIINAFARLYPPLETNPA